MKTNINEELNYIKFLFDYKKGVVISEQTSVTTINTTIDPSQINKDVEFTKKSLPGYQEPKNLPPPPQQTNKPENLPLPQQNQINLSGQDISTLSTEKKELESKINNIQTTLDVLNRKSETEEKQRLEREIIKKIEDLDSYLRTNCGKKITRLCKEYLKEKRNYDSQMAKLRNLTTEPKNDSGDRDSGDRKDASQKAQNWVAVVTSILGLFTSAITTATLLKKDKSSDGDAETPPN